jgi:hypothetical protein
VPGQVWEPSRPPVAAGTRFAAMGQPVTVVEQASQRAGVVRFSTNRVLSGMAHESFPSTPDPLADRPVDELARRLFDTGKVRAVHVGGNVITVELSGGDAAGLRELIEDLFTYYRPGVPVPSPADFGGDEDAAAEGEAS